MAEVARKGLRLRDHAELGLEEEVYQGTCVRPGNPLPLKSALSPAPCDVCVNVLRNTFKNEIKTFNSSLHRDRAIRMDTRQKQ